MNAAIVMSKVIFYNVKRAWFIIQEENKMAFPKFKLRKHLYLIGQNMSRDDLNSLKFLCSYHDVPRRQLEKIETAFQLFCALESINKIGYGNDKVLRDLLASRQKVHLLERFPINTEDGEVLDTDHGSMTPSPQSIQSLSVFLDGISDSLSKHDFFALACFLFDPLNNSYSYRDIEDMSSARVIFDKLITSKIIGPTNLTALYQVFEVIGRNDLCQRIKEYLPHDSHPSVVMHNKSKSCNVTLVFLYCIII